MTEGRAGFTLAEILVALVVLAVGVLGVASTFFYAAKTMSRARDLEWAVHEARSVADSLAHFGAVGDGSATAPFGRLTWTVKPTDGVAAVRIRAEDRAGRRLVDVTTLVGLLRMADGP